MLDLQIFKIFFLGSRNTYRMIDHQESYLVHIFRGSKTKHTMRKNSMYPKIPLKNCRFKGTSGVLYCNIYNNIDTEQFI